MEADGTIIYRGGHESLPREEKVETLIEFIRAMDAAGLDRDEVEDAQIINGQVETWRSIFMTPPFSERASQILMSVKSKDESSN